MPRRRTRLCDRVLPDYCRGEELFNMISHIVGGGFSVIALVSCIIIAAYHRSITGIVTGTVYGISLIALYTMSSIYHGLHSGTAKKVMQVLDHCMIYLLIAGTYTPILLCSIRHVAPVAAWILFGAVWGLAILAATLTAIDLKLYSVFSMICYIAMGWCIVFAAKPTLEALPAAGAGLLLSGGIAYTIGAVLYGLGKKRRYMHSVFHLFVLLGSILQYLCIVLFVM